MLLFPSSVCTFGFRQVGLERKAPVQNAKNIIVKNIVTIENLNLERLKTESCQWAFFVSRELYLQLEV